MIEGMPLCDGGKCAAILQAVAQRDDRISGTMADLLADAVEATLDEFGVDYRDRAVRAAFGAHLARLGATVQPAAG